MLLARARGIDGPPVWIGRRNSVSTRGRAAREQREGERESSNWGRFEQHRLLASLGRVADDALRERVSSSFELGIRGARCVLKERAWAQGPEVARVELFFRNASEAKPPFGGQRAAPRTQNRIHTAASLLTDTRGAPTGRFWRAAPIQSRAPHECGRAGAPRRPRALQPARTSRVRTAARSIEVRD